MHIIAWICMHAVCLFSFPSYLGPRMMQSLWYHFWAFGLGWKPADSQAAQTQKEQGGAVTHTHLGRRSSIWQANKARVKLMAEVRTIVFYG